MWYLDTATKYCDIFGAKFYFSESARFLSTVAQRENFRFDFECKNGCNLIKSAVCLKPDQNSTKSRPKPDQNLTKTRPKLDLNPTKTWTRPDLDPTKTRPWPDQNPTSGSRLSVHLLYCVHSVLPAIRCTIYNNYNHSCDYFIYFLNKINKFITNIFRKLGYSRTTNGVKHS